MEGGGDRRWQVSGEFNEICYQTKIAIFTTGVVNRPALFVFKLMAWEGTAWGITFLIHGGRE